jgi:predicted aspartyl protease
MAGTMMQRLLGMVAMAAVAMPAVAQDSSTTDNDPAAMVDLAAQTLQPLLVQPIILDRTDRMTLPVHINGQGPYGFVVDTGAERTVISNELAGRLNLATAGRARVVGIAEIVTADLFHAPNITLRSLPLGDSVVPAFSQANIGGPGLIGIDSLENHRLLIDFTTNRMDILPAQAGRRQRRESDLDGDQIVVTARRLAGRMILSNARLGNTRVDVILDTGAQTSVGNLALQRAVRREGARTGRGASGELTSITGATLAVRVGQIERISLGGFDFTDLPVAYADSPAFTYLGLHRRPALLLGMDALRLFERVSIDFANRRVIFDLPDQVRRQPGTRMAENERPVAPGRL